jgi:DNA mismatch repair protein MutS
VKTSQILGIVLTKRNNGEGSVELAGFPHHSIDSYLPKLVRAGMSGDPISWKIRKW